MDNQEKQIPLNTMSNNNILTQKIIVCFEYKVKPFSQNKISYLNELSLFCQKKQINLFPNHKDNSRVITHEEEILSLSEKKNYTEEEIEKKIMERKTSAL